jgi:hypothetical protein
MSQSSSETVTAEIPVRVIQFLATTEQQDVDFVLTRLGLSLHGTIAREIVASFRRQIIAVAAHEAVTAGLAPTPAVTGARNKIEEAACLIWSELCPGMIMGDDDLPYYVAAARAVLALADTSTELASTDELLKLADRIDATKRSWLPIAGHVVNVTFGIVEAEVISAALREAASSNTSTGKNK